MIWKQSQKDGPQTHKKARCDALAFLNQINILMMESTNVGSQQRIKTLNESPATYEGLYDEEEILYSLQFLPIAIYPLIVRLGSVTDHCQRTNITVSIISL